MVLRDLLDPESVVAFPYDRVRNARKREVISRMTKSSSVMAYRDLSGTKLENILFGFAYESEQPPDVKYADKNA